MSKRNIIVPIDGDFYTVPKQNGCFNLDFKNPQDESRTYFVVSENNEVFFTREFLMLSAINQYSYILSPLFDIKNSLESRECRGLNITKLPKVNKSTGVLIEMGELEFISIPKLIYNITE